MYKQTRGAAQAAPLVRSHLVVGRFCAVGRAAAFGVAALGIGSVLGVAALGVRSVGCIFGTIVVVCVVRSHY